MIKYIYVPTMESLLEGIRNIKIKLPDRVKTLAEEKKIYEVKGASYYEGDTAEVNDILTVKADDSQYEICLGKNFFDETVEKALVGMKINETKTVKTAEKEISVTVLNIKKKKYNTITLEQVKENLPQTNSLEEFDNYLYDNVVNNLIEESVYYKIATPVINKIKVVSKIEFENSDVDKDFINYAVRYRIADEEIKNEYLTSLVCLKIAENNSKKYNEENYNIFIKNRAAAKGVDAEKLKEAIPYSIYKYAVSKNEFIDSVIEYSKNNMVTKE